MKSLTTREVRYLVVGGYAVNAFGHVRNTVDIDIWIAGDAANRERTIQAIRDFGYSSVSNDLLDPDDAMVRMGVPPLRIEVMRALSGVEFEDCWPRRQVLEDGDLAIPFVSLEDLKKNKRAAGRPKDLADLSGLP